HCYVALERRSRPGKDRDTYPGDFVCFKCDFHGNLAKLYSELEAVSYSEARRIIALGKMGPRLPRAKAKPKPKKSEPAATVAPSAESAEEPAEESSAEATTFTGLATRLSGLRARLRGEVEVARVVEA